MRHLQNVPPGTTVQVNGCPLYAIVEEHGPGGTYVRTLDGNRRTSWSRLTEVSIVDKGEEEMAITIKRDGKSTTTAKKTTAKKSTGGKGTKTSGKKTPAKKSTGKKAAKATTSKKKGGGRPTSKAVKIGTKTVIPEGVGIQAAWVSLFESNEKLPKKSKMTDADISKCLKAAFPGRKSAVFDRVGQVRSKYNGGGFGNASVTSKKYDEEGNVI